MKISHSDLIPSTLKSLQRPGSAIQLKKQQLYLQQYKKDRLPGQNGISKYPEELQKFKQQWQKQNALDDLKKEEAVWDAFGSYIQTQLSEGKAIQVPQFGTFTFGAVDVDLKGTTNQFDRDKQERAPVFLISKDFSPGMQIKQAVQAVQGNGGLRPYEGKGASSGIIPMVKFNFIDMSLHLDIKIGLKKEESKAYFENYIKKLQELVRKGQQINKKIPFVGELQVKNGIAGVIFSKDLIQETAGKTAKQYQLKLFNANNNLMNERLFEQDKNKIFEERIKSAQNQGKPPLPLNKIQQIQKIDIDKAINYQSYKPKAFRDRASSNKENERGYLVPSVAQQFQNGQLEQLMQKDANNIQKYLMKDQKSQFSQKSVRRSEQLSKSSANFSRASVFSAISKLPDLAPFQLMNISNQIYLNKSNICNQFISKGSQYSLRDILSSSQIYKVLSKCRLDISIGSLKVLLKELGFNWNGPSCSLTQLLNKVKEYLNPHLNPNQQTLVQSLAVKQEKLFPHQQEQNAILKLKLGQTHDDKREDKSSIYKNYQKRPLIDTIKELLSVNSLYNIFKQFSFKEKLDKIHFQKMISQYSNSCIPLEDADQIFKDACRSFQQAWNQGPEKDFLTFNEFHSTFSWNIVDKAQFQNEAQIILKIKDWMSSRKYSSQQAFERLLRSVNRQSDQTLSKQDFHKSILINGIKLFDPQIDYIFDLLTGFKKSEQTMLDVSQWTSCILDEKGNSLDVIRNVVKNQGLSKESLLKKLEIRLWDKPLDKRNFIKVLRRMDESLGEEVLLNLFSRLQNKDNQVEIGILVQNIQGSFQQTIDYKVQTFKQLYIDIFQNKKQKEFISQCEQYDKLNDGFILPKELVLILRNITGGSSSTYSEEALQNFVQQIETNLVTGKLSYIKFIDNVTGFGNRNHNPFKLTVQKIELFLENNKIDSRELLKRVGSVTEDGVTVQVFAQFLKSKIEKGKAVDDLEMISHMIDIDKDGYISNDDLQACLRNLNSDQFFKDGGKALKFTQFNAKNKAFNYKFEKGEQLSDAKILQVCKQIRDAMKLKEIDPKKEMKILFDSFDQDGDGMLSYSEFSLGIISLLPISKLILEKMFGLMDVNQIGMVDFEKFERFLQSESSIQIQKITNPVEDDFQWQIDTIKGIKRFFRIKELSALDGFKFFDQDFDGRVSKEDMQKSLEMYINIPRHKITAHRIDRLFSLLSFYKTESLQPSDFDRLVQDVNPFVHATKGSSKQQFLTVMGGGYEKTSTFDWKLQAIQQIGMALSLKYKSIQESFDDIGQNQGKVNFQNFKNFIDRNNVLQGFNITLNLLQKLFAEIDPHNKTYLTLKDWENCFQVFNIKNILIMELKNYLICQFADVESAFNYLQTYNGQELIDLETFKVAVQCLVSNRKYTEDQIKTIYKTFLRDDTDFLKGFNFQQFSYEFENLKFKGNQKVVNKANPTNKGGHVTTIQTDVHPNWKKDIIAKLRSIIGASGKSIEQIFNSFDINGSGYLTNKEFRNAIRKLNLGLKSNEIDQILISIDQNNDGIINYQEFFQVLSQDLDYDKKLLERANNKLVEYKEKMHLHMTSHGEAYRKFDKSKCGKMTYIDFSHLISEICFVSNSQTPSFIVIKDLFDAVDIKKDGYIDVNEWNQTFNNLQSGGQQSSIKPAPLSTWDNSKESHLIGEQITRNRKVIQQNFTTIIQKREKKGNSNLVTFEEAKKALSDVIYHQFTRKGFNVSDPKLKLVLSVGLVPDLKKDMIEPLYDYMKILNLFKDKYKPIV